MVDVMVYCGMLFIGLLYVGLVLIECGLWVVEFNVCFGDFEI